MRLFLKDCQAKRTDISCTFWDSGSISSTLKNATSFLEFPKDCACITWNFTLCQTTPFTRPESGACILFSEVLQHDICFHSRHWHTEALSLLILVAPPDFACQSRPTGNAILTDRIILPLSAASSLQPYTHISMLITNLLNVINTQHMHPKNCTSILL
jgi:hypothetical protein